MNSYNACPFLMYALLKVFKVLENVQKILICKCLRTAKYDLSTNSLELQITYSTLMFVSLKTHNWNRILVTSFISIIMFPCCISKQSSQASIVLKQRGTINKSQPVFEQKEHSHGLKYNLALIFDT